MGYSNPIQAARTQLMNASPREPVYALIARELTASIATGAAGIRRRRPTALAPARALGARWGRRILEQAGRGGAEVGGPAAAGDAVGVEVQQEIA